MSARRQPRRNHAAKDRNAVLMMLAYVEAECRRLGAEAAAHHAALAAALVPEGNDAPTLAPSSQAAAFH
ncbi:MAG TPA: hypothetical protein VE033_03260 [Acetobacteraceae bacterium]|nr:hypothetical protein [Acetobacteraceae bacterium]